MRIEWQIKNFSIIRNNKKIYENAGYKAYVEYCDMLMARAVMKTHLDFEKISTAKRQGKLIGDYMISYAKQGRNIIEEIISRRTNLH